MNYRLRGNFSKEPEQAMYDILKNRNVEDVEMYLQPTKDNELNPYLLDNIETAARKLLAHLEKNSKILFIIDSDCDGYMSSSILWNYIKNIHPQSNLSFMVHEHKQHGLEDKIDVLKEEEVYDLIILPDAASFDGAFAKELRCDIICLDHHELPEGYDMEVETPENMIIVNNQLSDKYSNKSLCGAGVTYKFCQVLDDILEINKAETFIDLVALGEIADVMFQGTNETRYYVMEGLKNIKNQGFIELIKAQKFSLKEKAKPPYNTLTPIDIAFYISPLINAVTRVGTLQEKEIMFLAFTNPTKELQSTKRGAKNGDIELAAEQNARVAGNVRARQNRIKEKAIDLLEMRAHKTGIIDNNILIIPVEEDDDIPQELTGLIAQYFVGRYNKPCLIGRINEEKNLQGSIRGNGNFESLPDLKKYLEDSTYFNYVRG